jgi:alanine dehydrogenase
MKPPETLLLKRGDVTALLSLDECITAVEQAFKLYAEGKTLPPGVLGVHARDGGFHIKAAGLKLARTYFAAKVNGNFFRNTERYGMPNIQGIIMLCDGENGYPLALMDSIEITILRTGAATAVAAKYLARDDAKVATICGCGNQGRIQLKALMKVRALERVYAFDLDYARAERFAGELSDELSIEAHAVRDLAQAVRQSDVCVTCTPSRQFFLKREDVAPGTFIAAVGADDERKQELDPHLFAGNKIVVDLLEQCAAIGDLHHALDQGLITRADVHAELGQVVAGRKPGRTSRDEIIIFDSTGTALQDAAAAALVYEKAAPAGSHLALNFAG